MIATGDIEESPSLTSTPNPESSSNRYARFQPFCLATLAGVLVLATLGGPGITVDEPLDVRPGRTYVSTLLARGFHFFDARVVEQVFKDNAEHPPLGRWLLGIASTLGAPLEIALMGGADPLGLYLYAGRIAPALCFAVLVGLVSRWGSSLHGPLGGGITGAALLLMPRVFAHAHLGALDTFVCLFWVLALFLGARSLDPSSRARDSVFAGGALGLALLTKIHAWFLLPILFSWAWFRIGLVRAIRWFLIWAGIGGLSFFVGWPWLWYDTVGRLRAYLGTGIDRVPIQVLYFGTVYLDREVPWHYPWVYFLATVPTLLHVLGLVGLLQAWRDRQRRPELLLLGASILFFLLLFSSRVPVYDGERLFLVVFPLWSILIGGGFVTLWRAIGPRIWGRTLLALGLISQGYGLIVTYPFGLSYYNALVGGLPGAERLGLELTYWNDAVDPRLLQHLAARIEPGEMACLVPTLYPGQGIASTTRLMNQQGLHLKDQEVWKEADWLVVSRRSAYWPESLEARLASGRELARRSVQGVWISSIWHAPRPLLPEKTGRIR